MAHFAQINENNIVINVIVAEQDVIDSGLFGDPATWIQTSYNTYGGIHIQGGIPLRKNYAGMGDTYDEQRDAFIPPRPYREIEVSPNFVRIEPYESWQLDEDTCQWVPPIPMPTEDILEAGEYYEWNEGTLCWDVLQ